jgi:hypothetical protein
MMLLLLPLAASAECGFVNGEQGMTIVVGSKSNRCFDSGTFREAFRDSLIASVREMDGDVVAATGAAGNGGGKRRPFDSRNARGNKLWTIAERNHQATLGTASYYGQRR